MKLIDQTVFFFNKDSFMVSGGSDDRLIKIWSVEDLECINTFKVKSDSINCLKIYVNQILSTS
jgi:hypothetical protein